MTPTNEQIRTAIAQQAAEWLMANQTGPLGEPERCAFMDWLKTSPDHVHEYLRLASIARDLRCIAGTHESIEAFIAEARAERSDTVTPFDPPQRVRTGSRPWLARGMRLAGAAIGLASVAAAAVLAMVVVGKDPLGFGTTYETAHGEQRSWKLSDGSRLRLDTDTALRARFSRAERRVVLLRGQALFHVAHEMRRPFEVLASGARIRARGTEFDVYRQNDTALVAVVEGTVDVAGSSVRSSVSGRGSASAWTELRAGQQLRIESGRLSMPASADLTRTLAWLRGQIVFEQRPLGEVAAEFNRYSMTPISILDASVSELRISGVFSAYDADSFVAYVETLDGVSVERTPTRVYVRRRPSGAHTKALAR